MRIAQVAPLYESVPPQLYGGTERVVYHLTEELVRQGHDVTLFAAGDSRTSAELVAACPRALRLDSGCVDQLAQHLVMLDTVAERAEEFDLVHYHVDYLHFPVSRRLNVPHVTTLHGRLDLPELVSVYEHFSEMPVVSISEAQRKPLPMANWVATIYHGVPCSQFQFHPKPGDYFAFLGRISPEKRLDRAIEIAQRVGIPLRVAAKVDKADANYFKEQIEPLLADPMVQFIGEIGEQEKSEFLGNARALLFPIDWPEPFGLVMIEAMATGTPVVAFRGGSVDEVVDDGVTGFIVEDLDRAVVAARRITELDRARCRATFERRFSSTSMGNRYAALYQRMINPTLLPHALPPPGASKEAWPT
ncbi:MAG TPA: glycosyltransferase family 4 protein [Polyangiaceae bacterium]|jgi:glycosyltransferase involved in cell wall biosynthesis|nr:glycosyltransferase family 4 protein [Polyangiaceae bacterium]